MQNKAKFKLCLVIGEGLLPMEILDNFTKDEVYIIALKEAKIDFSKLEGYCYTVISFAKIGKIIKTIKNQQIHEVCIAGRVKKPSFFAVKPDIKGFFLLLKILKLKLKGDDALLKTIITFVENHKLKIKSVKEMCNQLLVKEGLLTNIEPSKIAKQDYQNGIEIIKGISTFDIGQSIVMQEGVVIGVEAIEGTDALIKRCGDLSYKTKNLPILIKCAKQNQTLKIDMPTIGLDTITMLAKYNFAGICVEAGSTILLQKQEAIDFANKNNIFIIGV